MKLARAQQAKLPYGGSSGTYQGTVSELRDALKKVEDCPEIDFAIERIRLKFNLGDLADSELYWAGLSWQLVEQLQVDRSRVFDATNALLMTLTTRRVGAYVRREEIFSILAPYRTCAEKQKVKAEPMPAPPSEVKSPFTTSKDDAFCKVTIFPGNSQLIRLPNSVIGLIDCGKYSVRWIIEALADYRIRGWTSSP